MGDRVAGTRTSTAPVRGQALLDPLSEFLSNSDVRSLRKPDDGLWDDSAPRRTVEE